VSLSLRTSVISSLRLLLLATPCCSVWSWTLWSHLLTPAASSRTTQQSEGREGAREMGGGYARMAACLGVGYGGGGDKEPTLTRTLLQRAGAAASSVS